jgi:hypothetical protein
VRVIWTDYFETPILRRERGFVFKGHEISKKRLRDRNPVTIVEISTEWRNEE